MNDPQRDPLATTARNSADRFLFPGLCALVLAFEATLLLVLYSDPDRIQGGDGVEYARLGTNLSRHGAFSLSTDAPYSASVARTPGYPLFLAALRFVGLGSISGVRIVQFGLVGVTAALVLLLARELASKTVARVAGILCLTYLPFLWLARFHLTEVLSTTLVAGTALCVVRTLPGRKDSSIPRIAAVGGLIGVLALVRPSLGLSIVPIGAVLLLSRNVSRGELLRRGVVLAGTFCLVLAPWTIRNFQVSDRFLPAGALNGVSLYASSQQYAGKISPKFTLDDWSRFLWDAQRLNATATVDEGGTTSSSVQIELAANQRLSAAAKQTIQQVPLSQAVSSLPKRIAYLWSVADYPPTRGYRLWHVLGQAQYLLVAICAGIGVVALSRQKSFRRPLIALLIWPAYLTLVHLIFHVESRYTIPVRPVVLLFSAIGIVAMVEAIRNGRWRSTSR